MWIQTVYGRKRSLACSNSRASCSPSPPPCLPPPCLTSPTQGLLGASNQPGPDDWLLEELWHNDEMHLLDRKNGKLFTVPGDNNWPRPIGARFKSSSQLEKETMSSSTLPTQYPY